MLIFGVIIGLIILVLLVVVHELGHGIVARRNGVVVEEFGVGFPPKAWGKKIEQSLLGKNVLFTLNWLPLGGFVKLQGEHDSALKKGDYGAASYWVKTKILLAGVVMNWVVAIVLIAIVSLFGVPKIIENQFSIPGDTTVVTHPLSVGVVMPDSAAEKAGLKVGDEVLRLNGASVSSVEQLSVATEKNRGTEVEIIYSRDNEEANVRVQLAEEATAERGYLGIGAREKQDIRATWSAPLVGVGTTIQFTWVTLEGTGKIAWDTLKGFAQSFSLNEETRRAGSKELNTVSESVAGPVGILGTIFPQGLQAGLKQLTFLAAIISLSLAVMNTLPIPALDGGRWFTMTVFRLLKKPLTKEREEKIQTTGFIILLALVVLITFSDVGKFF
jgi:regulator of sigma E protease